MNEKIAWGKEVLMQDNKTGQFLRFAVVGVIAAAIHYLVYLVAYHLMPSEWAQLAYCMGFVVSLVCNFWMTSKFTFRSKATVRKGAGFLGAHLVNFGLHNLFFFIFTCLGVPKAVLPIPTMALAVPINFCLVRLAFKQHD